MQSSDNTQTQALVVEKTLLLLLAVALNTIELFIPRIALLPWLKPGLANSVTLIWLIRYGMVDTLLYTILRSWIASFYFGFSLLTVSLSMSGGIGATLAMGLLWHLFGRRRALGTIGLAIVGALFHNTGQLVTVYFLLTRNRAIFYQLPFMGLASLLFGAIVGLLAPLLWSLLHNHTTAGPAARRALQPPPLQSAAPYQIAGAALLIVFCGALVATANYMLLGGSALLLSIAAVGVTKGRLKTLFYPLRFGFFFLFIALTYLFFSYGKKIPWFPLITYEGLTNTTAQMLRLWTWLQAGILLQKLRFNSALYALLSRLFPGHAETLASGLIGLEYFPAVFKFVRSKEARAQLSPQHPRQSARLFLDRMQRYILDLITVGAHL